MSLKMETGNSELRQIGVERHEGLAGSIGKCIFQLDMEERQGDTPQETFPKTEGELRKWWD